MSAGRTVKCAAEFLVGVRRPTPSRSLGGSAPDGPFRGVPFLLKDLGGWLAGVRVTRGSRFFADAPEATADSEHVRRLKRAGLVIFGRTNSCELGLSLTCEPALYGPTKNPWDTTRISGGSSGARRRPSARASFPWRTLPTGSARSARRRRAAGSSG